MKNLKDIYLNKMIEREDDKVHALNHLNTRMAYQPNSEAKIKENNAKIKTASTKIVKYRQQLSASAKIENLPKDVLLRVDHLTMQFGGLKAVDDLSFEVLEGEIFGLIGPNGAGKTTVFNCITQFYKPTKGTITFKDAKGDTLRLNDYKVQNVIKQGISRTFQNVELISALTVLENMLVGAHSQYHKGLFAHFFKTKGYVKEDNYLREKALKVLEYMGLAAIKDVYVIGLPYGIMKKIELARTLMSDPKLIILDEPAAGLNDLETAELAKQIKQIQKDFQVTIFLVEHDMDLVMGICDHICAISFGKKLAIGTPEVIQSNQLVKEAYLGGD